MPEELERSMSIDEFLTAELQKTDALIATVEATDDPRVVKVTPYIESSACLCSGAFLLPKDLIKLVQPRKESRRCCGHDLRVVELTLVENAKLNAVDVFKQMKEGLSAEHLMGSSQYAPPIAPAGEGGRAWIENASPNVVCNGSYGYQLCRGSCGEGCFKPSAGEQCSNGQVCNGAAGYQACGCRCFSPSRGEQCYNGKVYYNGEPPPDMRVMTGCHACDPRVKCYRPCWDENGQSYWQPDRQCC